MTYKTFAAIDVGSYEVAMKIFEISEENGIKEIDHIRHRIELGTDSYHTGKITNDRIDELCRTLREFKIIMESYKVDEYKAYGTSAIRETDNTLIILDQIKMRTGIYIEVLGNSAQRFLDYKSVASKGQDFLDIIEKGTVFIDVGGGSMQISLFDKDSLVTTQNIKPGVLRLREELWQLSYHTYRLDEIVGEILGDSLNSFKELFLEDRKIENIILVDDYVSFILQKGIDNMEKKGYIDTESFLKLIDEFKQKKPREISKLLDIPEENTSLVILSALMLKHMVNTLGAKMIWAPGVCLCDGMAYEYAEGNKLLTLSHNFEQDMLASARQIVNRYHSSEKRTIEREKIALTLFDYMQKIHGLSKRDRLLLQLAAILYDCGRFISLINAGQSSFNIVMATEMIGISHDERMILAYIVKYSTESFEYYEQLGVETTLDKDAYLRIAKMTAIMRLTDGLDISHKAKCNDVKVEMRDSEMVITIETNEDMTLERGMFGRSASFFEEVYNIKPVIEQRKSNI